MPYIVTTESGSKVRVAMPTFIAQRSNARWVDSAVRKTMTPEERKAYYNPTLIVNNKNQYKFVPRYLADSMIDAYQAVEIGEDEPEYFEAYKLALGRPKHHAVVSGVAIHQDKLGIVDYDKELERVAKSLKDRGKLNNNDVSKLQTGNGKASHGVSKPALDDEDED